MKIKRTNLFSALVALLAMFFCIPSQVLAQEQTVTGQTVHQVAQQVIAGETVSPVPSPPLWGVPAYYLLVNLWGEKFQVRTTTVGQVKADLEAVSADEKVTLYITKGVLAQTEDEQRLRKIEVLPMAEPPPLPENGHIIGIAYNLAPAGATFDPAIWLEIRYDPSQIPRGIDEEDLLIAYYDKDSAEWVELDCVVDTENATITAPVEHFTTFAIIGVVTPPPAPVPAAFALSWLDISPAEVSIGETVSISLEVANIGGMSGRHTVTLKINGVKEADKSIMVAAGGSRMVSFSVTPEETGSYTVNVDGLSGSFTVTPVPGAFLVTYLSIHPTEVQPGQIVTITVGVTNTYDRWGVYSLVLKINGVKEAEKQAELDASSSQDVSFSLMREDPGSYTVFINGFSGSFTVVAPAPVKPPINWPVIGGVIVAGVVVGLLIFFLLIRRRAYKRI